MKGHVPTFHKIPAAPRVLAAWLIGLVFSVSAVAQRSGTIRGEVFNEKDKPVPGATVYSTQIDSPDGSENSAQTDDQGNFVISGLAWGKYTVTAEKIDAGYPRTPSRFYGSHMAAAMHELSAKNAEAKVKIIFRGKVSSITGTVIDDEASVPIPATFLFRHAKDPANVLVAETQLNYRILLPASIGLTLEVSSPNHRTWYYPGTNDATKKTTLELSPGQTLNLNIRLDNNSQDCACLDRPQRWGLGPDSPAFQWHKLQDEARGEGCSRHGRRETMPDMTELSASIR
ncbi:MAG: carboxypeptidase-like regulatory domain-containing protein [Terriglobales bacterium]|jgi:Carboxypeptidase regulatory-like domain